MREKNFISFSEFAWLCVRVCVCVCVIDREKREEKRDREQQIREKERPTDYSFTISPVCVTASCGITGVVFLLSFCSEFSFCLLKHNHCIYTHLFILLSGLANGSRMSTSLMGCCSTAPTRSQSARFRMRNAVALRRIDRYRAMKYTTKALPTAARMMHNAWCERETLRSGSHSFRPQGTTWSEECWAQVQLEYEFDILVLGHKNCFVNNCHRVTETGLTGPNLLIRLLYLKETCVSWKPKQDTCQMRNGSSRVLL